MTRPVGNMRCMTDHTEATSPTRQFAPLAIIIGIPLIFAAIFFYTSPVVLETGGEQGIFKCGPPSSPNSDAKNVCAQPEKVERNKAIYSGLAGVGLLGLGAVWMLRGQRHDDEWDEDSPRRGRGADIDLRGDDRDPRGDRRSGSGLRGVARGRADERPRSRPVDDDRQADADDDLDVADSRSSRRSSGGRRSVLRDDDFADPDSPRRTDDDWSSDGWR